MPFRAYVLSSDNDFVRVRTIGRPEILDTLLTGLEAGTGVACLYTDLRAGLDAEAAARADLENDFAMASLRYPHIVFLRLDLALLAEVLKWRGQYP